MRKGIGVSPGVAVGTAYCLHEIFVDPNTTMLEDGDVQVELARYEAARDKAVADLRALHQKVARQSGQEKATVFQLHESILHDAAFASTVHAWIVQHRLTAQAALQRLLAEYTTLFSESRDDYLKERVADVRDVIIRLSEHLSPLVDPHSHALAGPLIVVAEEVVPSQIIALGDREIAGIVTQSGAQTGPTALIARSRGIPAVSGVRGILSQVKSGDVLVVDGREGHVLINPEAETEVAYRKLQREFFDLKDALAENRDLPAVSADGQEVELLANINNLADARAAVAMGASGVGLFRTEYLFLTHPSTPSEEEQLAAYREIIAASPRHRVTIRTLDLGGDKTVPYLGRAREANPFMGWRSIRLSFEHPESFATQIRAVLRSAAPRPDEPREVRLLFPMVTTLEEMRRIRAMVRRARRMLIDQGREIGEVQIGLMLEVPAAAATIDLFLQVIDFVSIGSNDLVQYLTAADRDNPKVSHLCQPLAPPVLQVLHEVIQACREAGKPVTLCGEMAGAPRAFVLLFGMGLRSFSMSPAFIPTIKELTSHLTENYAEVSLDHALRLKTAGEVRRFMAERVNELAPSLKILDQA
ncbi:MAG: phosphoenolpyruvate--protein phosphotransferase [Pirellulales bacterium]|jgi:phosphoenolpyruvate-protein phosphotransferase (PTS system enzyme I)